jgi:HK97 family phage major capsid protein
MAGLEGNVVIPRQTAAGTAYAVSEIAALTLSNQVLDQIAITPKRVGTTGTYSKQLVLQSSIDVESFMRDDFLKVIAIMWDHLIINGQGSASEPLGILNTPGIGSVTFGAAATYAKLVSFWTAVAAANADVGEMAYVTTPTAAGVLQSAAKLLVGATTVAAVPIWEGGGTMGRINGYTAEATNQMPNNMMLFGVMSEVIHALWGGLDVVIDPYTLAKNAEVVITMNTWGDVVLRHPQCFCASADPANQ